VASDRGRLREIWRRLDEVGLQTTEACGDCPRVVLGSPLAGESLDEVIDRRVKFLTDWAGPEAMVKNLAIRLGVPAFPGDPLRFTGSVTGKSQGSDGENFIEVTFKASNSLGDHVSGTAVLSLLDGAGT